MCVRKHVSPVPFYATVDQAKTKATNIVNNNSTVMHVIWYTMSITLIRCVMDHLGDNAQDVIHKAI